MLTLTAHVRVFVCTQPADMRKSFDGLAGLVQDFLGHDPLSGHLFVFRNRRGDRLKLLYWDADGLAIWYKRLEEGTFRLPALPAATSDTETAPASLEISRAELALLLGGIDLKDTQRRPRYQRPAG